MVICPFSCVYLTALERIFISTCLMRCISPVTFSCFNPFTWISSVCCLFLISDCIMTTRSCRSSPMLNSSSDKISRPLSIFDISNTSLIRLSNNLDAPLIFSIQSSSRSRSSTCALAMAVIPMIAFMGVRISWLMRARKSDLAWLAFSAESSASFNCSDCSWSFFCNSRCSVISVISINTIR